MTTIQIKKEVPEQVLRDIFTTALEGGSNYWYWLPDNVYTLIAPAEEQGKFFVDTLFDAVYKHGIVIPIHDLEEPTEEIGKLDISLFSERLQACADNDSWALDNELNEEGDAVSSDIVFQYLALGELTYG